MENFIIKVMRNNRKKSTDDIKWWLAYIPMIFMEFSNFPTHIIN